jgi:hypothetical protein
VTHGQAEVYAEIEFVLNVIKDNCMAANVWTKPLIAILPLVWRVLQCFRRYKDQNDRMQLVNAGKYATGLIVGLFSALRSNVSSKFFIPWLISVVK